VDGFLELAIQDSPHLCFEYQNKIRRRNTPSVPWNMKAYHGPGPVKFAKMTIASIKMSLQGSVGKNVDHDDL
jgi:hypothetical protein